MAAKIVAGSPEATEFHSLTSFEQQTQWCLNRLAAMENTYNNANPNNVIERVTVDPNYDTNQVTSTLVLTLAPNAVQGKIVDGVQAYLA